MISQKKIKGIAKNNFKKLSKQSLEIINKKTLEYVSELVKKASRSADFSGRILIKSSDFD